MTFWFDKGGALSQAKGAFSTWWNTLNIGQPNNVARDENLPDVDKVLNSEKGGAILRPDFSTESLNCGKIRQIN